MTMISTTLGQMQARSIISKTVETVLSWRARRRNRTELGWLDDRMLRDIALTLADVYRELHKPFWRG
jgi:uncharacterized protein YjiS (DUF1127 family)